MSETKELILDVLAQILNEVPEQRFGQVIYNYLACHCGGNDTFYVTDESALNQLQHELENIKNLKKTIDK